MDYQAIKYLIPNISGLGAVTGSRFMMVWLASTILSKIVVLICNIMTFNWLFITDSFFDKLPVWFQRDY